MTDPNTTQPWPWTGRRGAGAEAVPAVRPNPVAGLFGVRLLGRAAA